MNSKLASRAGEPVVVAESRAAIVAALATSPGLVAVPNVPDVPTEGAAWPVWVQSIPSGALLSPMRATYDIYALLPAGYVATTVEAGDGLVGQMCRALWNLCLVELAEPVQVRFDNQTTMPGIRLRATMRGSQQP